MKGLKIAGILLAATTFAAAPAYAHSSTSPDNGSRAYDTSGPKFNVDDPKCDGYIAYGFWNNANNRLDDKSGCGTTATRSVSSVTSVKACTNIPLASDPCSNWH